MNVSKTAACLLVFLSLEAAGMAWGPLSHVQIALDAMKQANESIPPDCMGAFLAGCTEPDIGAGQGSAGLDNGVSENYQLYHDPVFVDAMIAVAKRKGGKEGNLLLARAKGFQAHILADSVAHTGAGYPNSKQLYNTIAISEDYMPNHIGNELCLDLLAYNSLGAFVSGKSFDFIDAKTMDEVRGEYAKQKGIALASNESDLEKQLLTHRLTVESEISIAKDLQKNNPKRLAEIETFYSDRTNGVNGTGGMRQATESVSSVNFGELSKTGKIETNLKEKVVGGFHDLIGDLTKVGANTAVETAEGLVIMLNNQKKISETVQSAVNENVESRNNRLIGNLVLNLLRQDGASFAEILLNTEKAVQGSMWNAEDRLKALKIEEELLAKKEEEAKKNWENRPWWNLWLLITNADQNTYLTLKARHEVVLEEIAQLEGRSHAGSSGTASAAGSPTGSTANEASDANSTLNSVLNQ